MKVLAIESSCDETSVALYTDNKLKVNLISSQLFHNKFGGVVPELSSRAHLKLVLPLLRQALNEAGMHASEIDVYAATAGPGLIGALLVGLTFTKGLAYASGKPFIAVNHIEGHIFSGFATGAEPEYPFLALVVSGGHTLLLLVKSPVEIIQLGTTVDDAAGEAFDKVSKLLGMGYPGGPVIQKHASLGDKDKIRFPVASLKNEFDFSFSGLKTAVLRYKEKNYCESVPEEAYPDIAAGFQEAVVKSLLKSTERALDKFNVKQITVAGGVSANSEIRRRFGIIAEKRGLKLVLPNQEFCGDNAAMIAYRAIQLYENGILHGLDYNAFPSLNDHNSFIQKSEGSK